MISRKIHVGLVGLGFGEKVLLPVIRENPACEIVAFCARRRKKSAEAALRHGIKKSFSDWRLLVRDPEIDAVVIATPPRLQFSIACAAIGNQKHVFCEKPLALSKAEAKILSLRARRSRVANMVDFEFPEIAAFIQAKALLEKGVIGKLRHVAVSWNVETYANKMRLESWKTETSEGGGALFSFVCHSFYYLEWMFGKIDKLEARLFHAKDLPGSGDTMVNLLLSFKSGGTGVFSMSTHAFFGNGHRMECYGENGKIILENPTDDYGKGFRLFLGTRKSGVMREIKCREQKPSMDGRREPVSKIFNRFIRWVQTGKPARPSFEEGARVQTLLAAALKSDKRRSWVTAHE